MAKLTFVSGSPHMVNYKPDGAAVAAGEVVLAHGMACIAHRDIADGELGAVAWPRGTALYKIAEGNTFTGGEDTLTDSGKLYVENGGNLSDVATSNTAVGTTLAASTDAADAVGVHVVHNGANLS